MTPWGGQGLLGACFRDLRRRTEPPNGVVKLIIVYKAATAVVLMLLAFFLLGLVVDLEWNNRIRQVVMDTGLRADNRFISDGLKRFGLLSRRTATTIGLVSLFYALLETTEVVGLLDRRRWAEYLVFLATVLFLPYEAVELLQRATFLKALILLANVGIAVYLVRRKRLFFTDCSPAPLLRGQLTGDGDLLETGLERAP